MDRFTAFQNKNILVIGDVMIDAYLWGKVDRISPEAPVPVVNITKKDQRLGGSANVALNLKALNAKVFVAGICGKDDAGQQLLQLFAKENINTEALMALNNRPTTIKTRVLGHHQQMLRIDEELNQSLSSNENLNFLQSIQEVLNKHTIDCIILEDYNKGCLNAENIPQLIALAKNHNIPVVVDPKKENFKCYQQVSIFKPNLKELKEGLHIDINEINKDSLHKVQQEFFKQFDADILLLTLSEHGVYICSKNEAHHIPAHIRDVLDVSGAGDTVVSVAALAYVTGFQLKDIAALANLAGGLVCEKVGVVPIHLSELVDEVTRKKIL
jgi:D-glycero-beta-D-manno-heptose-7-phosphate kinase